MFELELHLAECEFLTGELVSAEKRLSALVGRAADVVRRAAVTRLRTAVYMTLDRPDRAIEVGLEYLRHVGIEWPQPPSEEDIGQELERMRRLLGERAIEQLIDLPSMSDPGDRATMDVLSGLFAPTLLTDSNLYDLVVLRMTTLSLEHGNDDASCYAYAHINRVLGFRFGDYQTAFRFGQLACDLVQKRGLNRFEHRVYASLGAFALPWMKDVATSRALIRRGFDMANASGDLTYAVFGFKNLITNLVVSGEPLGDVQREAEQGLAYARKARFGFAIDWFTGQLMLIRALRGLSLDLNSPDNAGYGDRWYERHLEEQPPLALCACTYWIHKLQACVLAQDQSAAIEALAKATPLLWSTRSFLEAADYHFYGALTQAAACDSARREERAQRLDALLNHHGQLMVWAGNCPANFANRAALVGAEIARLEGRDLDAMRLYEEAIRSAREHKFIQNEGIANELAARFYATRDFETIANTYLRNARYCYLRWGADAKVRQLDQLHPHLLGEPAPPRARSTISTPIEQLDLATVIEVSQAVWGEIVLEKLIDTVMRTAVEHAGAERGLLILAQAGDQRVAAEVATAGDRIVVQLRDQAVAAATLPQSVFHFVLRTQQNVILDDAAAQSPFSSDPYIREHGARSVLCLPLLKQARLMGMLYLENRLAARVFTPARIAVLNVLASQAAIALENARLYSDLRGGAAHVGAAPALAVAGCPRRRMEHRLHALAAFCLRRRGRVAGCPLSAMAPLDRMRTTRLPIHPEDAPLRAPALQRQLVRERHRASRAEFRLLQPDGVYRWRRVHRDYMRVQWPTPAHYRLNNQHRRPPARPYASQIRSSAMRRVHGCQRGSVTPLGSSRTSTRCYASPRLLEIFSAFPPGHEICRTCQLPSGADSISHADFQPQGSQRGVCRTTVAGRAPRYDFVNTSRKRGPRWIILTGVVERDPEAH